MQELRQAPCSGSVPGESCTARSVGWERELCVLTFTSVPVQLEGGWKTEETKDNQSNIFVSFLQDEGVRNTEVKQWCG